MLEYAQDLKVCIKADGIWGKHPARWSYQANKRNECPVEAEKVRERAKVYYYANKDKPGWKQAVKDRRAKSGYTQKWREKNKARSAAYMRQWKANNPDKWRACVKRSRKKRAQNPQHRMRHNLRGRIREFMRNGAHKQSATKLLGCNRQQLMQWIEAKFTKGMEWNNYGQWQVDHILPCASFDLTNPEQQRRCFHYTNLQPLWSVENLLKSDTIQPTQPELCMSLT